VTRTVIATDTPAGGWPIVPATDSGETLGGSERFDELPPRETVNYAGLRASARMRFRFEMEGDVYSKNKESFKRLLAKHGLRWRGSLDRPFWASGTERVTAVFDRDGERDVLRSAALVWESAGKSRLLEDMKAWAWEAGVKAVEDRSPSAEDVTDEVEQALRHWDIVWKPNEDSLKAQGRPKAWIEADVKRWKQQRQERRRELVGQATD